MIARSLLVAIASLAFALPTIGHAQVAPPTRVRLDTLTRAPFPASPGNRPMHGDRICIDCGGGPRLEKMPAYIIKDTTGRVLAMVPPGDSAHRDRRHPITMMEPANITEVSVVRDTAVRALGRGFENGIIVIVLSPAGAEAWRHAMHRTRR